jgi:hypothetical protein
MVHLPHKMVKITKIFKGIYYHKPKYDTKNNNEKTLVNHTIEPITELAMNFVHIMIAGVNNNIYFAGVGDKNITINIVNPYEHELQYPSQKTKQKW